MHPKIEGIKSDNYLLCNYRFSDKTVETIKAEIRSFMSNREKDDSYYEFINWQQKENELVALTMYAYSDIQLPWNLTMPTGLKFTPVVQWVCKFFKNAKKVKLLELYACHAKQHLSKRFTVRASFCWRLFLN
jgi:hypothetical protein